MLRKCLLLLAALLFAIAISCVANPVPPQSPLAVDWNLRNCHSGAVVARFVVQPSTGLGIEIRNDKRTLHVCPVIVEGHSIGKASKGEL